MAKYKVQSVSMTFSGTAYKVKKLPAGKGVSCDPVDVTCLDDDVEQYIPGALKKFKEFTALVQGITEAPAINTVGDVVITATYNDGTTDTAKTVTIKGCILKEANPPEPEAGGDRAANWELVFQPNGSVETVSGGGGTVQ